MYNFQDIARNCIYINIIVQFMNNSIDIYFDGINQFPKYLSLNPLAANMAWENTVASNNTIAIPTLNLFFIQSTSLIFY